MCKSRWQLSRKRKRLPEPPWSKYIGKSKKRKPPTRNGRDRSSAGSGNVMPCEVWKEKGLSNRTSITVSTKPLEPVPTLSLIRWDGANMSGLARGHTGSCMGWGLMERQSHGPPTAGRENGLLMGPG